MTIMYRQIISKSASTYRTALRLRCTSRLGTNAKHPSFSSTATSQQHQQQQEQVKDNASQKSVMEELRESIHSGKMVHDVAQEKAAKRLSNLQKALGGYCNRPIIAQAEGGDIIQRIKRETSAKSNGDDDDDDDDPNKDRITMVPRGLFLHGSVGTGKTHLMDIFYELSPIAPQLKRRVHFHSFMQNVHKRIFDLNKKDLALNGRNFAVDTSLERNPIHRVAVQLASEVSLLCFDEFQVTDVADALILSQLFQELFRRGTVVVATSNRHPSTLYEGGLNRSYFLPFIDLLCRHCIVHDMNAETDYRIVTTAGSESLFYVSSNERDMEEYHRLLGELGSMGTRIQRNVEVSAAFNRKVIVPQVYGGESESESESDADAVADADAFQAARFHFRDLCNTELGSSDYRAISQQFDAVIIDEIPVLTLKEHDQARRFITLVDELYEAKCVLACNAIAPDPDSLFVGREIHAKTLTEGIETETVVGEAFGIDVAQSNGLTVGGLASVQELSFAFKRAASRLKEMTSKYWWERKQEERDSLIERRAEI